MPRRGTLAPLLAAAALMTVAVAAPARAQTGERHQVHPSGFLGDYSDLQPHPDRKGVLLYVREPGVLAGYDSFILEPVLIWLHPESEAAGLDPEELAMLTGALREAVAEQLSGHGYGVVGAPGPRVARIRAAITDVVPVNPAINLGATAVGAVAGVGLLVPRIDLGRADIEAEFLDSTTGERLAAVVATRGGRRFGGKVKGAKRWGDVKAAFAKWAKQLRKRLDAVHGKTAADDGEEPEDDDEEPADDPDEDREPPPESATAPDPPTRR